MSDLALVVFDVDGTLVDSQAHIIAALSAMYKAGGRPAPARNVLLSIVGLSLPQAIGKLEPDLSDSEVARWVDVYKASFAQNRQVTAPPPLFPGAKDVLDALAAKDHILLGVATGKSRRGMDHLAKAHDLSKYFVTMQTADHHPSKPHPAMLETALVEAGVEPASAVMVGDTTYDIEMAASAGVRSVAVTWGYHSEVALKSAGADRTIEHFEALPKVVSDVLERDI